MWPSIDIWLLMSVIHIHLDIQVIKSRLTSVQLGHMTYAAFIWCYIICKQWKLFPLDHS